MGLGLRGLGFRVFWAELSEFSAQGLSLVCTLRISQIVGNTWTLHVLPFWGYIGQSPKKEGHPQAKLTLYTRCGGKYVSLGSQALT